MNDIVKKPCEPMVGADIECFVVNSETYQSVPCVGILPGTKEHPEPMLGHKKGFAIQEDNVMAEFNIPPAKTYQTFTKYIGAARKYMYKILAEKGNYEPIFQTDMLFKSKDLTSPQAKTIGCEPDFDAYQGGIMRPANGVKVGLWRGAGGHVHIGGDFQCPDFVAALFADVFIGLAANAVPYGRWERNKWYGQPGIYRPKPYGIEYRTPCCNWAANSSTTQRVGSMALKMSKWLTESDAKVIQQVFRQIDWSKVHGALITGANEGMTAMKSKRSAALKMARTAGVPA